MTEEFLVTYIYQRDYPELNKLLDSLSFFPDYKIIRTKCYGPTPIAFHIAKTPTLIVYSTKEKKELRRSYGTLHIANNLKELLKNSEPII